MKSAHSMVVPSIIDLAIRHIPDSRLKNYLAGIRLNAIHSTHFRINYNLFRNLWVVTFDNFSVTFARNPYLSIQKDLNLIQKMPLWEPEIIIDANPGQGTTGILLALKNPSATVYLIQPEDDDILMENVYLNNAPNIVVVPRNKAMFGAFLVNEVAGHFFDKSIVLKLHLPECSHDLISAIADIWRYNHLRVILTSELKDNLSYSYDLFDQTCKEEGLPFLYDQHNQDLPVSIKERNLMG
jgi:hypothetical protein